MSTLRKVIHFSIISYILRVHSRTQSRVPGELGERGGGRGVGGCGCQEEHAADRQQVPALSHSASTSGREHENEQGPVTLAFPVSRPEQVETTPEARDTISNVNC